MAFPFVCKAYTPDQFPALQAYLDGLSFNLFRPKFIVVHNTAPPTLADYAVWQKRGSPSDEQWGRNLEAFYKSKWSGGPHFVATPRGAVVLNPPNAPGVHTPSWNRVSWGVETVGDFETDAFEGPIADNLIALLAVLHHAAGINPTPFVLGRSGLHFHKEDHATTHQTCPGRHMDKVNLTSRVIAAMGKLRGADPHAEPHPPAPVAPAAPQKAAAPVAAPKAAIVSAPRAPPPKPAARAFDWFFDLFGTG